MGRGGRNAGHNHVLAAIADAIHANSTYKGTGKGSKGGGGKGQWQQQDGRNCPNCGDYNFGFRAMCRQCGTRLPPAYNGSDGTKGKSGTWGKGTGKGPATTNAWNGKGVSEGAAGAATHGAPGATQAPAAAKPAPANEEEEARDPAERVREIRSEEEKLRRARGQFADNNPRMVAAIDAELEQLATEREKLQPLEVNLQAAAGRTANARASLSKAKEKRTQAAKELRTYIEAYKAAEKDVAEAEAKLLAAEAAATARRSEAKVAGVQEAVELLRQTAAARCGDTTVAAQVAAALQQIADVLGAITPPGKPTADDGGGEKTAAAAENAPKGGEENGTRGKGGHHPVFAVCGDSEAKSRRTLPLPQQPAALVGAVPRDAADGSGGDSGNEQYAGGAVDGEINMEVAGPTGGEMGDDLLAQAAAVLGDEDSLL